MEWNYLRSDVIYENKTLEIFIYNEPKLKIKPKEPEELVVIQTLEVLVSKEFQNEIEYNFKNHTNQINNYVYIKLGPGDTLWDISRKYDGLSIEKLKKMNNLKSNKITPGQKLLIG